jgi:hypothetical protein
VWSFVTIGTCVKSSVSSVQPRDRYFAIIGIIQNDNGAGLNLVLDYLELLGAGIATQIYGRDSAL